MCEDPEAPRASVGVVRRLQPNELSVRWDARTDNIPPVPYSKDASLHYATDYALDILDEASATQLVDSSLALAKTYMKKNERNARCFREQEIPDDECLNAFVGYWLSSAGVVQPATDEDRARFVAFGKASLEQFGSTRGKELLVAALFATPKSIYRTELGEGEPDAQGRRMLSGWEIGQSLAFGLTGHGIDRNAPNGLKDTLNALRRDVNEGMMQGPADVEGHVRAILDAPTDKDGNPLLADSVRRFFRAWLGYGSPSSVFKSGGPKIKYNPAPLDDHTEAIIKRIVLADQHVLRELLTTREMKTFGNKNGGPNQDNEVYNITDVVEQSIVTAPADQRAGVLTQPAWLAAQSRNVYDEAHAVYRGHWIRENLLCGHVPEIPITVDALLPNTLDKGVRERLESVTEGEGNEYCSGCHALMNPLGVPFEIYDHRGQWRAEEQVYRTDEDGKQQAFFTPVDASSTLVMTGDPNLDGKTVRDAVELMELLSTSPVVEQCFVRQTFRYFMGRSETEADACTLAEMYDAYAANDGSMKEMLVVLFTSDTYLYRTVPADTEGGM